MTLSAQVSSTGITAPDYATILAALTASFQSIYGSDAVLTPDSQDGQWIAIQAQAIYDANQMAIATYNSFSPTYAQGVGLASLVKINGLTKKVPTASTVTLTIGGQANKEIVNGSVGDNLNLGTKWNLPASVTTPDSGTIDVVATCATLGSVSASPGTLTQILTPTLGWQSVTNAGSATLGNPTENDAALRQRQSLSVAIGAETILDALFAALSSLPGVTRVAVYENDTDLTDSNGIPPHSIACVVLGGDPIQIAQTIANKKSPGTGTYGTTSEVVFDSRGVPSTIHFYEMTLVPLTVVVNVKALTGYLTATGEQQIKPSVATFINGLTPGEDSYLSRLYTPANLGGVGLGATFFVQSILQARSGSPSAANVVIAFNETATSDVANITVNVS